MENQKSFTQWFWNSRRTKFTVALAILVGLSWVISIFNPEVLRFTKVFTSFTVVGYSLWVLELRRGFEEHKDKFGNNPK